MSDIIAFFYATADAEVWSVWFLIGAALVFFMQCGFAMVETGFTRAKNAGNIIMKKLMDFCIGTPMFMLLGFGLMMSENYFFDLSSNFFGLRLLSCSKLSVFLLFFLLPA